VVAVLESWENMTLSANDVIVTSSRGNMAVIPCDVSWTSRPPAKLEFQRDSQPPTTLTTSRRQFFHFAIDIYTSFFTARCYASAVLAMALCPSVRLSVRPPQVGVLLKRLNIRSRKQRHTIAQGVWFSDVKDLREIRPGSSPTGAPNTGGVGQNRRLSTNDRLYLKNGTR